MKNRCDFRKANQWEYGLDLLKVLLRLFCKGCEHIELVRAGGCLTPWLIEFSVLVGQILAQQT